MKRSRLRRRSPLRAMSAKRAARLDERAEVVRLTHERAGWRCEAAGMFGLACSTHGHGYGLDCHELQPRGRGGSPYDLSGTVSLCRIHHSFVTDNPAVATHAGLLRSGFDGGTT